MEDCKFINYSEDWRDKLRAYMLKTFPSYTEAYIDYCLDCSSGATPSIMVLNEHNDIVGCQLFYCTKVLIQGEEMDTHWGHDTYLDKEYRGAFGLDFVLYLNRFIGFGLGLTSINNKILHKKKAGFMDGTYSYYSITRKVVFTPFQMLFGVSPKLYDKDELKVENYVFHRIYDAKEMTIPNNGFWLKNILDVDFIRDEAFLNNRFLHNNVHSYYLYSMDYKGETCYFVFRGTKYRNMPAITLCDFRYSNPELSTVILKAFWRIAVKSNIGILLFVGGDTNIDKNMSKVMLKYKLPMDFVVHIKVKTDMTYCVTGADSDVDFLKG